MLVLGRRHDAIRLAAWTDDDERSRQLEYRAGTATAFILVLALVVLFLAAGVRGESGLVYGAPLLLGELTRLATLAVVGRRS